MNLWQRLKMLAPQMAVFVVFQAAAQALGFIASLLILRGLTREDYAIFTMASLLMGQLSLLTDTGIGTGLSARGGQVWQDSRRLADLMASARWLRRRLLLWLLPLAGSLLLWMLMRTGLGWGSAFFFLALTLAGVFFHLEVTIDVSVARLLGWVSRVQKSDLVAAALRLGLVAACFGAVLTASTAFLIGVAVGGLQAALFRFWMRRHTGTEGTKNPEDTSALFQTVRRMWPTTLFYCFQGQVATWLLVITGSTLAVADLGAMGRLAACYLLVGSVLGMFVQPAMARCPDWRRLLGIYGGLCAGLAALGVAVVSLVYWVPQPFLWVLGSQYAHVKPVLALMAAQTAFSAFVDGVASVNFARGWMEYVWLEIPLRLLLQVALLQGLDVGTVEGVLWFGLFSMLSPLAMNLVLALRGFRHLKRTSETTAAAA
jgi:hypothetical protein